MTLQLSLGFTVSSTFQRARSASPSIVFFDEIDAIVGKRSFDGSHRRDSVQERILSMLLNEMDGIEGASGVLVMVNLHLCYCSILAFA